MSPYVVTDRRRFLHALASAVGALAVSPWPAHGPTLRLGLLAAPGSSTDRGARLGAEEAMRAAALFGAGTVELVAGDAHALLRDTRARLLVGGDGDEDVERVGALADEAGALLLNTTATADALRAERCRRGTFHVAASEAMRRAARAAARAPDGDVLLWHESLERFGAAQLGDRFRARYGQAMDSAAWAGWAAVKLASEAALRARSAEPAALAAYLVRAGVRFDGHKGAPLTFGTRDHQLRQPLYVVVPAAADGRRRVEEVPARGHAPENADAAAAHPDAGCSAEPAR
jgi:ABC-type branched-subunit amino acid transport system substrate-binding protein